MLGLGGAPGTVWALALQRGGGGSGVSGGSQLSLCHLLVTLRSPTLSSKTSFQRQPPQRALMRAAAPPRPHSTPSAIIFLWGLPATTRLGEAVLLSKGDSESPVSLGRSQFVTFWCPGRLCRGEARLTPSRRHCVLPSAAWAGPLGPQKGDRAGF